MERKVLGKGLQALIPEVEQKTVGGEQIASLSINEIMPSPYQPRLEFSEEKLNELVSSIQEKGIIQPLLVRAKINGGYELIAGERRFRAARKLGLAQVPAIIKSVNDTEALELSLIENLQRENLNIIEEAKAYNRLVEEFNFTQEAVAQVVGKQRSTVTNVLRLLNLPEAVKELLSRDKINLGHAKALLSLASPTEQSNIAQRIVKDGLSVRQTESLAQRQNKSSRRRKTAIDPNIRVIEQDLQRCLGTKVKIVAGKKRGKIEIEYYSLADLDRILQILQK